MEAPERPKQKTGELVFQFNDNNPIVIADVPDYERATINLKSPKGRISKEEERGGGITFHDGNLTMRIYIRSI